MKQKLCQILLSYVLALCIVTGLCAPARAANLSYTDLGILWVAVNGDIYQSLALLEESSGKVYLPAATVEEFLGECPRTIEFGGVLWGDISAAADSCVYDGALESLYIWDGLPEVGQAAEVLYPEFGEPSDAPLTYREFFAMIDTAVLLADPDKLSQWQAVLPSARSSGRVMSRIEGAEAILYLALTLGDAYSEFNMDWSSVNEKLGETIWEEVERVPDHGELLPNPYPYNLGGFHEAEYVYDGWDAIGVAMRYTFGRASLVSRNALFDYDRDANSMHFDQPLTVRAATTALTRLLDSVEMSAHAGAVDLNNPAATHYDDSIITPALLAWAEEMPPIFESGLPEWNGAVLGGDNNVFSLNVDDASFCARKFSEYGFNCMRYMLTYQSFFDLRVTEANLGELRKLDQIVAYAIRHRIHLNLCFSTMPGRWSRNFEDYSAYGEFDLFTNKERQEEAKAVCRLLAQRYAGIPNEALSFNPLWETQNSNLSTGLPADPIIPEDVALVYADLVREIHMYDPDRFVIYEPTAGNDAQQTVEESRAIQAALEPLGNVHLLTNFCSCEYVYAEMPDVSSGVHVDNCTHSMFKPAYPVTIYFVSERIETDEPLILRGDLPAGTRIDIYLAHHTSGKFGILADDASIYSETLVQQEYTVGGKLSGLYQYAKSDKMISVTLSKDAQEVRLTFDGKALHWSGMNVVLPEQCAVERWWFPSAYDQFLGEENAAGGPEIRRTSDIMICPLGDVEHSPVTIHADTMSYTSELISVQANRETINEWGRVISGFAPRSATRIEIAAFSVGTQYDSALAYYGDVLDMCDRYNLGWFTNDFAFFTDAFLLGQYQQACWKYAGSAYTNCADGQVLKEMLQLYQSHMPVQTPTSQLAVEYGDAPTNGTLYLAGYDTDGKMVFLEERKPDGSEGYFLFVPQERLTYRAFLVDSEFRPVGWMRLEKP